MTFIYDSEYLPDLLIAGIDKKVAQQMHKQEEFEQAKNIPVLDNLIVETLLNRLAAQAKTSTDPAAMSKEIGTNSEIPAQPKVDDLTNINGFLGWLGNNQITWNNLPIVIIHEAPTGNTPAAPVNKPPVKTWGTLEDDFIELFTQSQATPVLTTSFLPAGQEKQYRQYGGIYWVNPQLLKNFLYSLQQSAAKSGNNLFIHLIGGRGGLLEQINGLTDKLGVQVDNKIEEYKKQFSEQKAVLQDSVDTSGLNEETVVDKISNPMLLNNPRQTGGSVLLRLLDLKNQQAFYNWVNVNKIKYMEKGPNEEDLEEKDYCKGLNYLHARALTFMSTGGNYYKAYEKRVAALMSANGCPINIQPGQSDVDKANYQTVAWTPGSDQEMPPQLVSTLVNLRFPLIRGSINIAWIKQWLDSYEKLTSKIPTGEFDNASLTAARQIADGIMSPASFEIQNQSLSVSADDIYREIRMAMIPKYNRQNALTLATLAPAAYVQQLIQLILKVDRVLLAFRGVFFGSLPEDLKRQLDDQFNIKQSNLNTLNMWAASIPSAKERVERGL